MINKVLLLGILVVLVSSCDGDEILEIGEAELMSKELIGEWEINGHRLDTNNYDERRNDFSFKRLYRLKGNGSYYHEDSTYGGEWFLHKNPLSLIFFRNYDRRNVYHDNFNIIYYSYDSLHMIISYTNDVYRRDSLGVRNKIGESYYLIDQSMVRL